MALTDPRLVGVGDKINGNDGVTTDIVRGMSVVLHLANGTDQVYRVGSDQVDVLPPDTTAVSEDELPPMGE